MLEFYGPVNLAIDLAIDLVTDLVADLIDLLYLFHSAFSSIRQ